MPQKKILLNLDKLLTHEGQRYQRLVASVRLARDDLDTLANAGVLGCSVTWVPDVRFNESDPFNLSWWRGGAAAITDLNMV